MERRTYMRLTAIIATFALCNFTSFAQDTVVKKQIPLHVEASFEGCRGSDKMLSFGPEIDINYSFMQRLVLHAVAQCDFYIPHNGKTRDSNKTFNVGGGLGYVLWLPKQDGLGALEFRALAAAGVSGKDFKNNAYKFGFYWHGQRSHQLVQPIVGVGYKLDDFTTSGHSTFHSGFISIGVRF